MLLINAIGYEGTGGVFLYYGVPTGTMGTADADAVFLGEEEGEHVYDLSAAGDLDGDGLSDLVFGVPYDDEAGEDAGAVHIFYGGDQ